MTSKCGKNKKVAHEAQPSVSLMFLPHFDVLCDLLGNLRSTTKFTTTTSVDRESTGARTSVSAGNRKLKMQSLGRTTTALNVNKL